MDIQSTNGSFESDSDICDINEINELFSPCLSVHTQSLGPEYILHLSATSETYPNIVAALSDYSCDILNLSGSQVAKVTQFKEHTDKLIDCRFSTENSSLLYTGSNDGTIKLWDLRKSDSAITFKDTTSEETSTIKPISSFDVSPCNRLLSAGTDLTEGDPFILFWDIRTTKLLGAYWESHKDDITQVKFHSDDGNKLISGSTDGLINSYDLTQGCEDDALLDSLNTEALIEHLQWFNENGRYKINCITSTADLQLWETDGAEPYKIFRREDIAKEIRKKTEDTYLVNTHPVKNSLLVLAGSNASQGRSLRSLHISNGQILPAFQFIENRQRVRASWLNENVNLLLTGGEDGKLDVWKPDLNVINFRTPKEK